MEFEANQTTIRTSL